MIESGVVWALSALFIFTGIALVYFLIFFFMFLVVAWGIGLVMRPVIKIVKK
jgi:hypothetical protein